jgi:hypothetical protein
MNCAHCQRRLLLAEKPEFPDLDVEGHLAGCQACRDFQRQLLCVEANVPRVPVPASDGKQRLLQLLLQSASPPAPPPRPAPRPAARTLPLATRLAGDWRRWGPAAAAVAVAAAVLIACGVWLGNWLAGGTPDPQQSPPLAKSPDNKPDNKTPLPSGKKLQDPFKGKDPKKQPPILVKEPPLVPQLVDCDLKLAQANTARERLGALAVMAQALERETRALAPAAPPAKLLKLAELYRQVVGEGVVAQARELPAGERGEVLPGVAVQLAMTARDAEKLAKQLPAEQARALRALAAAAQAGKGQLDQLTGLVAFTQVTLDERTQQLRSDEDVIDALVRGGLDLAGEDDPLKRADHCNCIVDVLAREIKKAVARKDGVRVALLSDQMQELLVQGVAVNVTRAQETVAPDSPGAEAIARVGEKVALVTDDLAGELDRFPEPAQMQPVRQALAKGKQEVEKAVKGNPKGKGKGPPPKKK